MHYVNPECNGPQRSQSLNCVVCAQSTRQHYSIITAGESWGMSNCTGTRDTSSSNQRRRAPSEETTPVEMEVVMAHAMHIAGEERSGHIVHIENCAFAVYACAAVLPEARGDWNTQLLPAGPLPSSIALALQT